MPRTSVRQPSDCCRWENTAASYARHFSRKSCLRPDVCLFYEPQQRSLDHLVLARDEEHEALLTRPVALRPPRLRMERVAAGRLQETLCSCTSPGDWSEVAGLVNLPRKFLA